MKYLAILALMIVSTIAANAQARAEVTISLNEAFFDAALEGLFRSGAPLEFELAATEQREVFTKAAYTPERCPETIKLQKEIGGVRSAVRFRDGKILVPLAFAGNYNPPLVGCVPFSGWAESVVDLEFDAASQKLSARIRVVNVNLSGTGGIGGSVIAKMVQSSIDKKVNPIRLVELDKLSFTFPVSGSQNLRMKAVGVRHELQNTAINVIVAYEFVG